MKGSTGIPTQAPAGLRGAVAADRVGPAEAGRPAPERGRARPHVRRVADHRRASGPGPAVAGSGRAPGGLRHLRVGDGAPGRAVLRPVDSGPRRDRHLRAGVSGHDGVAAGAQSRARLGQRDRRGCRQGRSRLAVVPAVHRAPRRRASSSRRSSSPRPADDINHRIAQALDDARIPVVLLDRTVTPYPRRGHHDLVGIDNRRAGFIITEHVLRLGSRRIAFVAQPNAAATVDAREAGYREALYAADAAGRSRARPSPRPDRHGIGAPADGIGPSRRRRLRQRPDRRTAHADVDQARLRRAEGRPAGRHRRRGVCGAAAGAPDDAAAAVAPDRRRRARRDAGARGAPWTRRRGTSCSTSSWSCGSRAGPPEGATRQRTADTSVAPSCRYSRRAARTMARSGSASRQRPSNASYDERLAPTSLLRAAARAWPRWARG